jgi:hypothetical protein
MKKICLAAALLAVSAAGALAQSGTVNAYTSADEAKAKAAVTAAGFTPVSVATAQAGNLYIVATKGADKYFVTVTPDGHVYPGQASGGVPQVPVAPLSLPPGSKAPDRGPRNGGGD